MGNREAELASLLDKFRAANRKKEQAKAVPSEPDLQCRRKTGTLQQQARFEEAIKEQCLEREKGGWRASARWLEEFCEEFQDPRAAPRSEQAPLPLGVSSGPESSSAELRAGVAITLELQGPCIASGSPQSSVEPLPASPPIPPLESGFWQGLLYGSADALIAGSDATRALHLISDKLGIGIVQGQSIETLCAGAFRQLLRDRFEGQKAELTMKELWRSAPASPGAPMPAEDQSQLPPGPRPVARNQPRWVTQLNAPGGVERDWRIQNGLWCG